ncbi:unnamed protein product [Caenorhabditis nigoni]
MDQKRIRSGPSGDFVFSFFLCLPQPFTSNFETLLVHRLQKISFRMFTRLFSCCSCCCRHICSRFCDCGGQNVSGDNAGLINECIEEMRGRSTSIGNASGFDHLETFTAIHSTKYEDMRQNKDESYHKQKQKAFEEEQKIENKAFETEMEENQRSRELLEKENSIRMKPSGPRIAEVKGIIHKNKNVLFLLSSAQKENDFILTVLDKMKTDFKAIYVDADENVHFGLGVKEYTGKEQFPQLFINGELQDINSFIREISNKL